MSAPPCETCGETKTLDERYSQWASYSNTHHPIHWYVCVPCTVKIEVRELRGIVARMADGYAFPEGRGFSVAASWQAVLEELAELRREVRELKRGRR